MWPFTAWSEGIDIAETVRLKRDRQAEAITQGLTLAGQSDGDGPFLSADASEIVSRIRSREWTSRRVMEAYIRSSARVHERTNCLTEIMYSQALEESSRLDAWISNASDTELDSKLLLGLPMSLKDQLNVKGYDSTIGFVRYCNDPAEEDAVIVQILRKQGAIPFCKTNVPQTMLAFECANPVWGKTTNPHSSAHVPGGSSGGEAALLALDGSPLGIGSDIGGSLRIPAHYSGVYSLKPVFGRIPGRGSKGATGHEGVRSTLGPMARSVKDLELCLKAISTTIIDENLANTEGHLLPLPYRSVQIPNKLRFGYFIEDGFITTSPACARAVRHTVEGLERAGHQVVPIELPSISEALVIFQALSSSDGYHTLFSPLLDGESREPALFLPTLGPKLPQWLRRIAVWALDKFAGESVMSRLVSISAEKRTRDVWKWQKRRDEYIHQARQLLWQSSEKGGLALDGVICPVQASPAVTHGATKRLSPLALHTILWNVVDSSVGVVPVTRVDQAHDQLPSGFREKIRQAGSKLLSTLFYKDVYDPKAMHNLPLGVQIVGPAWEEEKVLEMMKVVDDAVKKQQAKISEPGRTRR